MEPVNIAIIGAGVVGLAVAAKLSKHNEGVYVFERKEKFGQETSSHNSGVIHSGIHYPTGTLKAKLCIEGNKATYDICEKYRIPFKKLGKLTVAVTDEEQKELDKLMKTGQQNGAEGLEFLNREEVKKLEPNVDVEKALLTPSTGIVEPDELMSYYYSVAQKNGAVVATETEVTGAKKKNGVYEISGTSVKEPFSISAKTIVNCAGLRADKIAEITGLDVQSSVTDCTIVRVTISV